MRAPLSWLRDYVRFEATAAELVRRLSVSTLEVERVIEAGIPRVEGNTAHFVVGKVVSAEKHPNADRLQLCQVDVGNPDPQQIVCGAWNFGAGATVAVALPGATVFSKDGEAFQLGEAKLRGEASRGMILAEDEVGLGSDHDGIMVLPDGIEPGTPLVDVLPIADQVLDATATGNRVDLLSMVGLAREVAALFDGELLEQDLTDVPIVHPQWVGVEVDDFSACPRYIARAFKDVSIGASPPWLRARLQLAGMRSISNVVDVTNYVMHVYGSPLHVFDRAKLREGQIENNLISPSFDIMKRLCDGLKVSIEDFVHPGKKNQVSGRKALTRGGDGDYFTSVQYDYRAHASEISNKAMVPLEIQVRTQRMHQTAEFGVAAHWLYKDRDPTRGGNQWLREVVEGADGTDSAAFMEALRIGLFDEEVYVFTPKGELKSLPAGATPLDFAYAVHTDVGHRCVGAKVNGRIVPLSSSLSSGDIVEVLTSKAERGPSRDWLGIVQTTRARNKIRHWFAREQREDTEQRGRDVLQQALRSNGMPHQKVQSSPLFAAVIRDMGFKKAEDFYVAIGSGKVPVGQVIQKIVSRLKTQELVDETVHTVVKRRGRPQAVQGATYGITVDGVPDGEVLVRLAKCCTPVPGDDITGYVSVGRGITIHRTDCPNARALMRTPERFTPVAWAGDPSQSFRVTVAVDSWDRSRLLEDVGRTFAEHGCNVVEYGGHVEDQMARNWFVIEVGDVRTLRGVLSGLRGIESVFDAYRVTPQQAR